MRTSRDDGPIYRALAGCAGWGAVARSGWLDAPDTLFTPVMRACGRPDINLPDTDREGMDCSYCNGDLRHGSREKTPYVVGILV